MHNSFIRRVAAALIGFAAIGFATSFAHADSAEAWGLNTYGQLGNGSTAVTSNVPVAVSGMSSGMSAVACGQYDSLAIHNGGAYAWGWNFYGQLGNGNTTDSNIPVAVSGLSSGVTAVATGTSPQSLVIKSGAVYAWGATGQLATGQYTTTTPIAVSGLPSGVTAIAVGGNQCFALQSGAVYVWGLNGGGGGQPGTTTYVGSTPAAISSLSSGVTAIAGGAAHNLVIQNGGVYAWGENNFDQLGNDIYAESSTPLAVSGLSSGVTAIAAGELFSLAVKNGGVYGWGSNSAGDLGNSIEENTNTSTPIHIDPTDLTNIVSVAASEASSYALSSDGSLWVWGDNEIGELGLGTPADEYNTPQHLLAPSGYRFTSIAATAGDGHAVAMLAAVPEPASLPLLALAAIALSRRHVAARPQIA